MAGDHAGGTAVDAAAGGGAGRPARLLVASGSQRRGSLNLALARQAAAAARRLGAEVTELDLRALALPLYDGDLEADAGIPAGALDLRRLLAGHDALVLATPEYNAFVAPLPVNALHWLSRVPAGDGLPSGLAAGAGKVAALLSASPGALGGLRGLAPMRAFLNATLGMLVLPQALSVGAAHQAFDDTGALKDARQQQSLDALMASTLATARRLAAP
jgi:NAD(P)H-dependent FMN reductase